jgi:hypothetical protein
MAGRHPFVTLDVASYGAQRLKAPATLSAAEKKVFVALVAASPADQFTAADLDLLSAWAETTVLRQRAAKELEAAGGPVLPDGSMSSWFSVHQRCTKQLSALAIRLRISPQGRSPTARASKVKAGELSVYETMALSGEEPDDVKPS